MRCGCPQCDAYMVQSEGLSLCCVCPDCGYRCNACMGTGLTVTKEDLKNLAQSEWLQKRLEAEQEQEP